MSNKVTFGFRKVHIAFFDDLNPLLPTWEAPISVPGAVRWTPSTVGEMSPFYADDMTYYVVDTNNGYTAEWELANLPDAIKVKMFGWEIDDNGMIVEVADGKPKKFAIMGEVQGDQRNRRFVYYDCQASRSAKERTTKGESTDPKTDVISVTVSPIEIGGKTVVMGDIELSDTNAVAYNAFFSAVTKPTFSAAVKTGLAATIALAGSLTQATYTVPTWTKLTAAKGTATTINTAPTSVQAQIDAADRDLKAAISSLVVS